MSRPVTRSRPSSLDAAVTLLYRAAGSLQSVSVVSAAAEDALLALQVGRLQQHRETNPETSESGL